MNSKSMLTKNCSLSAWWTVAAFAVICACFLAPQIASAYSSAQQDSIEQDGAPGNDLMATLAVIQNPKQTVSVLENLLRNIVFSSNELGTSAKKRGLDLGMSRGFSGSQAGKHLMGLSAASFANGPGK